MNTLSTFITPELLQNRYTMYSMLRSTQPVLNIPDYRLWLIFGYDDVTRVLSDYANFSSQLGRQDHDSPIPPGEEVMRQQMESTYGTSLITSDPPRHRQLRDLVSRAFTPRAVANLEPRITALTHHMLDHVAETGQMDLIQDLAYPLPVTVIAEMLGIPAEDRAQFKYWSDQVVASGDNFLATDEIRAEQARQHVEATRQMLAYFRNILPQRQAEPRDDLISALLAAELNGERLSEQDVLSFCWLLLVAGNITTTNLIGNAILCLLDHPDEFARLQADPALLPSAVEEVLRYLSPVQAMFRIAAQDVELGGQTIRAGDRILAWIGSANRDEAKFPEPDRFDISRQPNPHIAFGYGIHYCLGAPLARIEARIALRAIIDRLPNLRRANEDPLDLAEGIIVYGVKSLPLRFST